MQRQIRTFRAATMGEALDLVRQELGEDAVVIESKEVSRRRLLPWPSVRQEIEISAESKPRKSKSRSTKVKPVSAQRTIRTLAESISTQAPSNRLLAPIPDLNFDRIDDDTNDQRRDRSRGMQPRSPAAVDLRAIRPMSERVAMTPSRDEDVSQTTLQSLQSMISQLERQSRPTGMSEVSDELYKYYRMLREVDAEEDIARELIGKLRQQIASCSPDSNASMMASLTVLIEREMRCAIPIAPKSGSREIVTLVGPTGVGKTTTLAKLAAHYRLGEGLRVGLITVDHYRVGAIEQLQTYAEILQIPVRAAANAEELQAAINELSDVDLLLIDTAGRSPFDVPKMNELRDLLRVAASNHVFLVLSLASGGKSLVRIADQFSSLMPSSLILTKLDEAFGGGGLLSIARDIPYSVAYCTTGQNVPDQIEPANPQRLAKMILHREEFLQTTASFCVTG